MLGDKVASGKMGKAGKCPLMAALVMLVSFDSPLDVLDGQAGYWPNRANSVLGRPVFIKMDEFSEKL